MQLREVLSRVSQIRAFENELTNQDIDANLIEGIMMSARNIKTKLCALIERLQERGLWLEYVDYSKPFKRQTAQRFNMICPSKPDLT
jgi:hypothetical protein